MSAISITPVILSGGAGTRLWPLSHGAMPKQFHALATERTMLQDTALRTTSGDGVRFEAPVVICAQPHRAEIVRQLAEVGLTAARIVLEPFGRNTAAAAYIAAAVVADLTPGSLALLLPADHVIADPAAFRRAMAEAAEIARARIVTFGITPDGPETGYGYIRKGGSLGDGAFEVRSFVEKPDADTAKAYLESGEYYWNSGMFVASAATLLAELESHTPELLGAVQQALADSQRDLDFVRLGKAAFTAAPSISIDYAVMERTQRAAVVPAALGWSDLGSWDAMWEAAPKDAAGNVTKGAVQILDSQGCYVRSEGILTSVIGLTDIAVVTTEDAILVVPRARAQEVKTLVDTLRAAGRVEAYSRRTWFPWRAYRARHA